MLMPRYFIILTRRALEITKKGICTYLDHEQISGKKLEKCYQKD